LFSTVTLISAHFLASSSAIAFWASTLFFSVPTISAYSSALFFLASTSTENTFSSSSSLDTTSAVSLSLITPVSNFSLSLISYPSFYDYMLLKSLINSKNDFGVACTSLLSYSNSISAYLPTTLNEYGMKLMIESLNSSD